MEIFWATEITLLYAIFLLSFPQDTIFNYSFTAVTIRPCLGYGFFGPSSIFQKAGILYFSSLKYNFKWTALITPPPVFHYSGEQFSP